ncbi:MAG: hypothetical protein WDZ35_16430 [Crocinitomicaceae bacterium]
MLTAELNSDWILSSEDYQIKEEPSSLSDTFARFYGRMLSKYLLEISNFEYSPNLISPELAAYNLKIVLREKRSFSKLLRLYSKIKDDGGVIHEIYQILFDIVEELKASEERLTKLQDPEIHSRLLQTVNQLQYSSFLVDR